ncbi:MAG: penicillin-binding protein 2 [bacterium]|nr:MAG: penicillin-binding protein 2 [bacterium]
MTRLVKSSKDSISGLERKIAVTVLSIILPFLLLLVNFWNMQVLDRSRYQRLADNNRIRLVDMPATRGIITDRNGVIIADSSPQFDVVVIPEDMSKDRQSEIENLAALLGREPKDALDRFTGADRAPYRAIRIFEQLEEREVAQFETARDSFPGAFLLTTPRRYYPFGTTASHLLGYVGEISDSQLASGDFEGARQGDLVGKFGLEKVFDGYLRGRDGGRQVEVDARGREINILGITEPVPGANMSLTIDIRLQKELEDSLGENFGAGVLLDVRTGEVLAMVSRPGFDPNEFSLRMSRERWQEILKDPSHPLQSRAIRGLYPPGSTFKVVTATASLMEGTLDAGEQLFCSGGYRYGRRTYRDWKLSGHGKVDLMRGIVESCDVYFYQAGERLGIDSIAKWALELGLGNITGIDLPGELAGLIPSTEWKQAAKGEPWYPGETLSAAIGQGYVLVTPLQLANLYATIARRGEVMKPFLVKRIETVNGAELYRRDPAVAREMKVDGRIWDSLIPALAGVVSDDHGTGRALRMVDLSVAGKTGTAQVVRLEEWQNKKETDIPKVLRDHAWFAAFAPVNRPLLASSVLVEHGGHGASAAAPLVARIFRKYLDLYEIPADGDSDVPEEVP